MTFRHAIGMVTVMAVIIHQAAANITPVAALLPRQSDGASGSPSWVPFSSPTGCDYGSDQSISYENCVENIITSECTSLTGTPFAQCGCNTRAWSYTCYNTYCPSDSSWSELSSLKSDACDVFTLVPGPFTAGQTITANGVGGSGPAATPGSGSGGGTGSPAATTGGSQSTASPPQNTSPGKSAGALVAPSASIAALVVGIVGILFM